MIDPLLINSLLIGKSFISKIYFFDELESTNDFARKNKLADGSLVITNYQRAGRGRFQRKWESEKGKNLIFSILKNFTLNPADRIVLVYFAAYSIYSAINRLVNEDSRLHLSIKWPNDILLNGRKIAGILIETVPGSDDFVIGVGLNVNQLTFSDVNSTSASSLLAETGKQLDLNELLGGIIAELNKNLTLINDRNFLQIHDLWKRSNKYIGTEISYLTSDGDRKHAKIDDITLEGKIVLNAGGIKESYNSTEIRIEI